MPGGIPSPPTHVVLKLAPGRIEAAAHESVHVVIRGLIVHDELFVGNGEPNAHFVEPALPVMSVGRLDPYLAPLDLVRVAPEAGESRPDLLLQKRRFGDLTEMDLQRHRHAQSLPAKVPPWVGANASIPGAWAASADVSESSAGSRTGMMQTHLAARPPGRQR